MGRLNNFSRMNNRVIKAVVFDMDGTMCIPQPWMFPAMRSAVGLNDKSIDILTYIDELPTEAARTEANLRIEEVEEKAMREMLPQPGLVELLEFLTVNNISKNICTRNVIKPVDYLLTRFIPKDYSKFEHIITRDFRPTKPNPDPLLHIAKKLNIESNEMMMIGDSFDDMKSGRSAGCVTVLLKNHVNGNVLTEHDKLVDTAVNSLSDVIKIVETLNGHQTEIHSYQH
ncbi:putative haloacid dehalogenase-like hydrolase NDAI_0C01450 [Naumovozyma dairenensis CBS 421]|uniref:HAD superfamily hydrolase n=1 Tax=Naumovozyma dairenensis (strain ATCC 10597 / BCRC 20456 / CBS 421 / NBRC 0211 / NRRL Y-12639) TaxID=1071378 RepID=G0W7P5_NAUDC|nr:hypothetical protein NDAI_0C01450 [Naumovozyma dairenensis CBS 421]CCD23806.1 hypothetical protein NDAI_0C01450 [Naumovozyma dairenensis CBS 421]